MRRLAVVCASAAIACMGCSSDTERGHERPTTSIVLYTKGASTDPYGSSRPDGFGVVVGPATRNARIVQVINPDLGWSNGAAWLGNDRIVVPRNGPPLAPPLLYRFRGGKLERLGSAPVPRLEISPEWSPDEKLIATEPVEPCKKGQRVVWKCYRGTARVLVRNADGSHPRQVASGHFDGWTPAGRLLIADRTYTASFEALDVDSGRRSIPLSAPRVARFAGVEVASTGPPRWSGDRRYLAALVGARWPKKDKTIGAIVVAAADGTPVRLLRSPYIISMFAWSPVGHRLAYTTSGFPDPHELFVLEEPVGKCVRLYATADHFDWITWSPDGRRLLLDEGVANRWTLFSVNGRRPRRPLRRLGGRPLWCCPVNSYATKDG
jgi:hypothetical protein